MRKLEEELMSSSRWDTDSIINIQPGGIQALLMDTHWMVLLTLMMACSPKKSLKELQTKKTTQIVTKTRAKFISPWRLEELTCVRAFLIPLKNTYSKYLSILGVCTRCIFVPFSSSLDRKALYHPTLCLHLSYQLKQFGMELGNI